MAKKPVITDEYVGGESNWIVPDGDNGERTNLVTAQSFNQHIRENTVVLAMPLSLQSLVFSGIVERFTADQLGNVTSITWRTGHLEHIANLYTGDPQTTERDYADDLAVARAYSADVWEALTGG